LTEVLLPMFVELGYFEEALAVGLTIPDDWRRPRALMAVQEISDTEAKKRAITTIATRLPKLLLQDICRVLEISFDEEPLVNKWPGLLQDVGRKTELLSPQVEKARAEAIAQLSVRVAEQGYPEEGLIVARLIKPETPRARALGELAPYLTAVNRAQRLREALEAAHVIADDDSRAATLAVLVPNLIELPCADLYSLGQEFLSHWAHGTRPHLLSDLCELVPVISALGGSKTLAETSCAIQDVGRWWP
jgi:hypothetical protein